MHALFKQNFVSSHRKPLPAVAQELPAGGAIHLKKHQHLRMHDGCGWTVHAMAGTVWITQDGDIRDIVLETGESFVLDSGRPAILSPLNEAQISLERGSCRQSVPTRTREARPSPAFSAARAVPI